VSKLPAFMFYPGDWRKDPILQRLPLAARGLLIELLCLMWENVPRGILETNGVPWTEKEILDSVSSPESLRKKRRTLAVLLLNSALTRAENGAIYSRRMVRDEAKRAAGRQRLATFRAKQTQPVKADVTPVVTHVKRLSSFSVSSSNLTSNRKARLKSAAELRRERNQKIISEALRKVKRERVARTGRRDVHGKPSDGKAS